MKRFLTILNYLKNKAPSIAVLLVLGTVYRNLPENHPVAFAELLYVLILILSVMVFGPLMRLAVFEEAAEFGESGGLVRALKNFSFTPALIHYWIATLISYYTVLVCFSKVLS